MNKITLPHDAKPGQPQPDPVLAAIGAGSDTVVSKAAPAPGEPAVAPTYATPATPRVVHALRFLRSEPALLVSAFYLAASLIGVWSSFWFYRAFGIPFLQYMQAGDFLVAALRDPFYLICLVLLALLAWVLSLPIFYERSHPQRVAEHRRRWWGRLLFPTWNSPFRERNRYALAPENVIAFAVIVGGAALLVSYAEFKARRIHAGQGEWVRVTLPGAEAALPQDAQLLGTSSAFVFLWWAQAKQAEVIPIESIGRLQSLPTPLRMSTPSPAVAK